MNIPSKLNNPNFSFIKIQERTKRPYEKDWANTNNYKLTDKNFKEYIKNASSCGILCGEKSNNLAVIDCDNEEIANDVIKKLPETFTAKTPGGGIHLYYIINDLDKKIVMIDNKEIHHGEVQFTGSQVLIPNSLHPNGNTYTILKNKEISKISKDELLKVISPYIKNNEKDEWGDDSGEYDIAKVAEKIEGLKKQGKEYQGSHPVHGSETGMNFAINLEKNLWHCYRCNSGGDALNLIAVLEGILDCSKSKKGCLKGKKFRKVAAIAKEKYGLEINADILVNAELLDNYRVIRYNKFGIPMINPVNLAKLILDKEDLKLLIVNNEANGTYELYYYNENGYYDSEGKLQVRRYINKYLEHLSKESIKNEVCGWISDLDRINRSDLEPDCKFINFKNGILNIETEQLTGHDPEQTFLNQIPWNWNPKAKCPKIMQFFNDILDPKYIPLLQEIFGYIFYRNYVFARLFIFFGSGRNGKGVTLNLMRKMLSIENYSSRKIHELLSDRFAKADLYCKMANIAGEMSYEDLNKTDVIKELTGSDIMTAQKKNKDAFQFLNYAKLIFNTNSLPFSHDKSIAFYDRICLIKFLKKFDSDNPKTDPFILDKISTNEEMEGLIVWAVEGLKRLLKNQKFSVETNVDEIGDEYEDSVNTEGRWLEENFESDLTSKYVSFDDIYDKYIRFCIDNSFPFVTKQRLGYLCSKMFKNMNQRCIKKTHIRKDKQRKSKKYIYFYGISWKNDEN